VAFNTVYPSDERPVLARFENVDQQGQALNTDR
jgi:hypothetical protein